MRHAQDCNHQSSLAKTTRICRWSGLQKTGAVADSVMPMNSLTGGSGISEGNVAALEIQFGFSRRPKHARSSVIEFAFPPRHDGRCQAIANEIHARATHVHQFIDAENNG